MKYMSERMFFVSILSKAKAMASSRGFKQTLAVSGSNIFVMGLGFVINILLAREMGVEDFGIFSFAFAVFSFVALFMEFGFYSTAAKILADTNDSVTVRKLLGGIFVTYIIINTIFAIFMYVVGIYIDDFFPDKIGYIVRMMAFSGYAYTAPFFMEWVLKGCNKIYLLSQYNFAGKFIYFIIILILWLRSNLIIENVLVAYAVSYAFAIVYCYFRLNPTFMGIKNTLKYIYDSNKIYGWPQYLGRIVDVGSANIDRLLISYFIDAKSVGLYSLAVSFVSVVSVLGKGIGITKYKSFAGSSVIDKKIRRVVHISTFMAAILVFVISYGTIYFVLGNAYYDVCIYIFITMFGAYAQGVYTMYNAWLSSHGYAKKLKWASFKMGIANLLVKPIGICLFSVNGASITFSIGYMYEWYLYFNLYDTLKGRQR